MFTPANATIAASDKDESKRPFRLVAQSTENTEALQDFDRHRQRGTWERAFKALEKAKASDPNALVPRDDDFYIPSRAYIRQLLASMPQAGKDAYRLFNDPEAKKLLEQASGQDEAAQLTKIVEQYFLATPADVAADRLGDLEFERGDVEQAADRWQSILRYRPETTLSAAQLLVKAGIALARSGRWEESRGILRHLRERHADATVRLGGREVNAVTHLIAVLATRPGATATLDPAAAADLNFPSDDKPLWQFQFLTPASAKAMHEANNNWMWNGMRVTTDLVPPAVTDEAHVYVNLVGFSFALDLKTGRLVWRSAKFHDFAQKMQQNQRLLPEQYGICVHGDRVFLVSRNVSKQNNNQNVPFLISAREATTGKELWTSDKVDSLKKWHIWVAPAATGDRVYVSALEENKTRDLHVLAINATDGKLLWSTHAGTYQTEESSLWNQRSSQPSLVVDGERLFVDTHVGSLLLLDTRTGATQWGFNYEAQPPSTDWWWGEPRERFTAGVPVIAGEAVYVKGMRSSRLCAVQLAGPNVLFKRSVSTRSLLIGGDEERLYLGGEEIMGLDRKTQKLLWATRGAGLDRLRPANHDPHQAISVHPARRVRDRQSHRRRRASASRRGLRLSGGPTACGARYAFEHFESLGDSLWAVSRAGRQTHRHGRGTMNDHDENPHPLLRGSIMRRFAAVTASLFALLAGAGLARTIRIDRSRAGHNRGGHGRGARQAQPDRNSVTLGGQGRVDRRRHCQVSRRQAAHAGRLHRLEDREHRDRGRGALDHSRQCGRNDADDVARHAQRQYQDADRAGEHADRSSEGNQQSLPRGNDRDDRQDSRHRARFRRHGRPVVRRCGHGVALGADATRRRGEIRAQRFERSARTSICQSGRRRPGPGNAAGQTVRRRTGGHIVRARDFCFGRPPVRSARRQSLELRRV